MHLRVGLFLLCSVAAPAHAESAPSAGDFGPPAEPQPERGAAAAEDGADQTQKDEASRRFDRGIKLYEEGDYQLALAEFERVYELVPDYRVLYNIGQVSIQLGRYARALILLERYLQDGAAELPEERRAQVRSDIEQLQTRTASLDVQVRQSGAELWLDGVLVGTTPLPAPLIVDVGERRLQVRRPGFESELRTFSLAGGDRRELTISLVPEAKQRGLVPLPLAPPKTSMVAPSRPGLLWAGWVATGSLATGGLVTFVLGASEASELETLTTTPGVEREAIDASRRRARRWLLAADILGGAALASGATCLYFELASGSKKERHTAQSVSVGVAPAQISVRFQH
jgi:hypothetical protein